ncbi:hypothetical protein Pmar_PMAR027931, partial [Perkinsus marinus ATCC 50983]
PFRPASGDALDSILEGTRKRASSFGNDMLARSPLKHTVKHQELLQPSESGGDRRSSILRR